jgi:hypothetical protein
MGHQFNNRNELMVSKRDGEHWGIYEADQPGDFARQSSARDKPGSLLEKCSTKKQARDTARKRARSDGHPFVLLCSTKGRISDVTWNTDYDALTIEPGSEIGDKNWSLKRNGGEFANSNKRSDLRQKAISLQEEYGVRYIKIYRKDGSLYWERQHPRWRRR